MEATIDIGGELKALRETARDAAQSRKQRLTTAHLLVAMLQREPKAQALLVSLGMREEALLASLKLVQEEPTITFDRSFERAVRFAQSVGRRSPEALHLLDALGRDPRSAAYACLMRCGVKPESLGRALGSTPPPPSPRAIATAPSRMGTLLPQSMPPKARKPIVLPMPPQRLRPSSVPPPAESPSAAPNEPAARSGERTPPSAADLDPGLYPTLSAIGRNLTALALAKKLDPLVGRTAELEQVLDVLARRSGNHPLVVGPAGVGKTALAEGLAHRFAKDFAAGKPSRILVEITPGAMLAGTGVRGSIAEKIQRLRSEIALSEGRVLLFFDDLHALVGESGPDELVSELKSALERGELPCLATTSELEHKRSFERDPALLRRFSRIDLAEPSLDDAHAILRGASVRYEIHHGVAYSRDALDAAIRLSVRYMPDRKLPEKSLEILDIAAAREKRRGSNVVEEDAIARVVSELAHVPLDRLTRKDGEELLRLETSLAERIVGHGENIARISDALRRSAAGFRGARPLGTFLLLGPTGVGKTETAKAISEVLFGTGDFTRIDLSEFSEAHSVARLLGAPPGYIGHDEGGQLTEAVRRRPYQLVLLDEIEKAHIEVLLTLLPLLDEGHLTDGRGRKVDFRNTVVVMTSNLGVTSVPASGRIGFGDSAQAATATESERALASARRALPPELWNRIDDVLWFSPLSRENVREIASRLLKRSASQLKAEHRIALSWSDRVLDVLVERGGFEASLGARPMRRTIAREVEALLAREILSGRIERDSSARIEVDGRGDLVIESGRR